MIGGIFLETLTVNRYLYAGSYVSGVYTDDHRDPLVFNIQASIQPVTGEDMLHFPEGERTTTLLKLYTETPLHNVVPGTQIDSTPRPTKSDIVLYNGRKYEVHKVMVYDCVRPHYKVYLKSVLPPEA